MRILTPVMSIIGASAIMAPLPAAAQDWSPWQTVAGDPNGQGCSVEFSYKRREDKSRNEPHYQFWYRARNSCAQPARLRLIMQRTDGFTETMTARAGKMSTSWTMAVTVSGARLLDWGTAARSPTRTEFQPGDRTVRQSSAVVIATGALAEWSGKVATAVARQREWVRNRLWGTGSLVQSYGNAVHRARQDATRLQGLLDRANATPATASFDQIQEATRSLKTNMREVSDLGSRTDAVIKESERIAQQRRDSIERARRKRESQR